LGHPDSTHDHASGPTGLGGLAPHSWEESHPTHEQDALHLWNEARSSTHEYHHPVPESLTPDFYESDVHLAFGDSGAADSVDLPDEAGLDGGHHDWWIDPSP